MDIALKELLGEFVKVLAWHGGYAVAECPGGHQDARLYFDRKYPYLHCLHNKCSDDVAALNYDLRERAAALQGGKISIRLTPEEERAKAFHKQLGKITRDTREVTLPIILETPPRRIEDFIAEAGLTGKEDSKTQQALLLGLFRADDNVWIGDASDSGEPWYRSNFQSTRRWAEELPLPRRYQLICPAVFKCGSWCRSNDNLLYRKFLIYEADHLSLSDQLRVIAWLRRFLTLRAIIFSGKKSLHCWFDQPKFRDGERYRGMRKLEARLIGLDADKSMFRPAGTTRFCGVERYDEKARIWTGKQQQLMYIKNAGRGETVPANSRSITAYDSTNRNLERH